MTTNPARKFNRRHVVTTAGVAASTLALGHKAQAGPATSSSRGFRAQSDLSGKLTISTTYNEFPDGAREALAAAYNEVRPNVELVWETQDLPAGDYASWLGTQLSVDPVIPDIVTGVYQKDFRDYVDYAQYRYADNPHTGRQWNDDVDWDRAQEYSARGLLLGIPKGTYSVVWYYNKELFASAGVEPPTNWAEFVEVCATLKDAGITPITSNFQWQVPQWLREIYFEQYHTDWVETVRAQEGDWNFNPERDGNFVYDPADVDIHNHYTFSAQRYYAGIRDGALSFDTPRIAEMVRNFSQVFPQMATDDFYVVQDPYPTFLQRQAAMMVNTTGNLIQLTKDMDALSPERLESLGITDSDVAPFEWGTFLMPSMEGDLVISPAKSVEGSSASPTIIHKSQEQTDLALDFMMFYISHAGYQPYVDAGIEAGTVTPSGPLTLRDVTLPDLFENEFKNIQLIGDAESSYNSHFLEWTGGDIKTGAFNIFKTALDGDISPEEFATQIQAYVLDNLDTILERAGLTQADLDSPDRQPGT